MLGTAPGEQFPAAPESLDGKLSHFDRRLNALEAHVARLADALESEKAAGAKPENQGDPCV